MSAKEKLEWDIVQRLEEGRTNGSNFQWMVTAVHREAAAEITSLRAQVEELRRERDEARAEVKRWSENWNANVAEMSERFRAVNIERVIEATGQDIFALAARAPAAEQEAERRAHERDRERKHVAGLRTPVDLKLVETALSHASFALDGVVSLDEEDDGRNGGSATCQATKRTVDRALKQVRAALLEKSDG